MKTEFDLKSVLLLQLCYLLQNVRSKHHCLACRHSDEDSQSQENYSDLEEIPVVSMESPVPISLPQVNLPQILTPQMSMPSMTMRAGTFHTSLLTGQNFVFFRIPSSYINIMKTSLPSESTSTTTENPTSTNTEYPTTTSEKPFREVLRLANNSVSDFENEEDSDGRPLNPKINNEDNMMDSVLQNIMSEFSDHVIKTAEGNNDFARRRMMPTSLTKSQSTQGIPQFKILPIPDNIAKKLLSHLRAVKYISSSRKKRVAIFN